MKIMTTALTTIGGSTALLIICSQDMANLAEMSALVEDTVTSGATLGSLAVAGITAHLSPTLQRRSSLREEVNVQGSVTG